MYYRHRQQDQPRKKKTIWRTFERSSDVQAVPVSFSGIVWFPFFWKFIQLNFYTPTLYHSNVQLDSDSNVCISSVKFIYLYDSLIQSLKFISANFDV